MDVIEQAATCIRQGKLIIFPTETVYGLGADATNGTAVRAIYAAKGRPSFNPLIAHVTGVDMARRYADVPEQAVLLMKTYWPGPLTLVLNRKTGCQIASEVSAGGKTVAMRCPNHPIALELIQKADLPIAAPSANPFGKLSPTCVEHLVPSILEKTACVLNGGPCQVGVESTVVLMTEEIPVILRPGYITKEQIEETLSCPVRLSFTDETAPKSPGQLLSHYAPRKPLRINADKPKDDEMLLSFGPVKGYLNLSPTGDVKEAAHNLFNYLKRLDEDPKVRKIAVSPIPTTGVGMAINDRLFRASTKK